MEFIRVIEYTWAEALTPTQPISATHRAQKMAGIIIATDDGEYFLRYREPGEDTVTFNSRYSFCEPVHISSRDISDLHDKGIDITEALINDANDSRAFTFICTKAIERNTESINALKRTLAVIETTEGLHSELKSILIKDHNKRIRTLEHSNDILREEHGTLFPLRNRDKRVTINCISQI